MTEKLKPCPFCGGEVSLKDMGYFWMVSRSYKSSCKCRVFLESRAFDRDNLGAMERAKERLIEKWSKRTNPWHTGTPTEDGQYLVCIKWRRSGNIQYEILNFSTETDEWIGAFMSKCNVIAWQKIELYRG